MNPHLQRGLMLFQQQRFEMAVEEFQQAIIVSPNDGYAHSLLAMCYSELDDFKEAEKEYQKGIHLAPDSPYSFYAAATVCVDQNRIAQAEKFVWNAIEMDSLNPDYFALLASVKVNQKEWKAALDAAEEGLALDPEHVVCTNLRAIALTSMSRRAEAFGTIEANLRNSPMDATSHANMGWNQLEAGDMTKAMEHFREALSINPESEWARAGIVQAMKGRFFLYRIMLNWFLWMAKLKGATQAKIIFGGWIAYQVLLRLKDAMPNLSWLFMPLIIAYIAFAVMTWVAVPLFNLVLRLDKYGRLVLNREEKRSSTWVGLALLAVAVGLIGMFVSSDEAMGSFWVSVAIFGGFLIPVLGTYYSSDEGWPRSIHGLLALAMLSLATYSVSTFAISFGIEHVPIANTLRGVSNICFSGYIFLGIASLIGVQFLFSARPEKGTNVGKNIWVFGLIALAAAILALLAFTGLVVSGAAAIDPSTLENPNLGAE